MAVFSRRNNQTNVPAEIQEYYQTERRERAGVAWLLAIGTLLVTVVLAVGIFFGGRWSYRKIAHTDKPTQTQDEHKQDTQPEQQPVATSGSNQSSADKQAQEQKQRDEDARKADEAKKAEETKKAEEAKKAEEKKKQDETARQQQAQPAASSTPSVAATATAIPNTGPEDTLAIVFVVIVAGYFIHRILTGAASAKRQ